MQPHPETLNPYMNELGDPLSIQNVVDKAMEDLRQSSASRSKSGERTNVQDHNEEWAQLCQQAAVEKDPERLMRLVGRIVELLDARRGSNGRVSNGVSAVKPNTDSTNA
jgi:hypothetical protein